MNKLILCEGKTDAILLSYYLEKMCGWVYSKKGPRSVQIQGDESAGETVNWYRKKSDYLLICAVGSKNRFQTFYNAKIHRPLIDSDAFSKIAVIIDHDDESIADIEARIQTELSFVASQSANGCWVTHEYNNTYHQPQEISFLLQIIPDEHQGALETLLLDAISEDIYDKNIVEKSKAYVDDIAPEATRYIGRRRLITKAYLGVTWAIQSPQKVFTHIDDQLRAVRWETSDILSECFREIIKI